MFSDPGLQILNNTFTHIKTNSPDLLKLERWTKLIDKFFALRLPVTTFKPECLK